MSTPVLVAWSGGKDSALTMERLRADPRYRITGLLTTLDADGRVSAQGLRRSVIERQATALGLPLHFAEVPHGAGNDAYAAAFARALDAARRNESALDTIAFGDLFLADVRAWREALLARLGWNALFPLWGEDTPRLAREIVGRGWRAVLCCVDTTQLDPSFCGRDYDDALLADLPPCCDPCGENGEFHTCVLAGPWLEPLQLARGQHTLRDGRFRHVDLFDAADPLDPEGVNLTRINCS